MQKKIIALAIASALAMPAVAMAEGDNVVIYGDANISYDFVSDQGTESVNKVSSNDSKFGFKGAEDLGGGLSAFWQIESVINFDAGGSGFANRDSFAGIAGEGWGSIAFGANGTAYKRVARSFDQFGDTIGDNRAIMGGGTFGTPGGSAQGAGFDDGINNHVFYTSPNINGFTGIIDYVNTAEGNTNGTQADTKLFSIGANYDAGPLGLLFAHTTSDDITGGTADASATKFGASYSIDQFTFGGIFEKINDDAVGGGASHKNYYLFGKMAFGSDAIKVAYTKADDLDAATNTGADQFTIGYDHSMSKRTTLYALYTRVSNDTAAAYSLSPLGPTGAPAGASIVAGSDPSAFSVGMRHTF